MLNFEPINLGNSRTTSRKQAAAGLTKLLFSIKDHNPNKNHREADPVQKPYIKASTHAELSHSELRTLRKSNSPNPLNDFSTQSGTLSKIPTTTRFAPPKKLITPKGVPLSKPYFNDSRRKTSEQVDSLIVHSQYPDKDVSQPRCATNTTIDNRKIGQFLQKTSLPHIFQIQNQSQIHTSQEDQQPDQSVLFIQKNFYKVQSLKGRLGSISRNPNTSIEFRMDAPFSYPRLSVPELKSSGLEYKSMMDNIQEYGEVENKEATYYKENTFRKSHRPARYFPATSTHQSVIDMMNRTETVKRFKGKKIDVLAEFRQKMNEDFEKRFKTTQNKVSLSKFGSLQGIDDPSPSRKSLNSRDSSPKLRGESPKTRTRRGTKFSFNMIELSPSRSRRATMFKNQPASGLMLGKKQSILIPKGKKKKTTNYNPFHHNREKWKEYYNNGEEESEDELLKKVDYLNIKAKGILPPQNPLFKKPIKDEVLNKMVSQDIDMKLVRPHKIDFKYFRKRLIESLRYMKLLKLRPRDLLEHHVFSSVPYEKKDSKELIVAAKTGDLDTVTELLKKNKYLVYDFDNAHMTALHWAVKRGTFKTVKILIENGADVNAKDLIGRTSLYFAIERNSIDILKLLLHSRCDPWSTEDCNYLELCRNKPAARYYLHKSRQIHIIVRMTPPRLRDVIWEKESLTIVLDPKRNPSQAEMGEEYLV